MFEDLDLPKKKKIFEIGCELHDYSVSELSETIDDLKAEIVRLEGAIESKKASAASAEDFFKS